jgi:hypothetical protein
VALSLVALLGGLTAGAGRQLNRLADDADGGMSPRDRVGEQLWIRARPLDRFEFRAFKRAWVTRE